MLKFLTPYLVRLSSQYNFRNEAKILLNKCNEDYFMIKALKASKCHYYFAADAIATCAEYGFREEAMVVATNRGSYKAAEDYKSAIDHGMWKEAMMLSLKSLDDKAMDMFMSNCTKGYRTRTKRAAATVKYCKR